MIEVKELTKCFDDKTVLEGINTVFEDGTRVTVQLDSGEYTVQYPQDAKTV